MDMAQVRMTMLSTAVDLGEPGVDARFGWGCWTWPGRYVDQASCSAISG